MLSVDFDEKQIAKHITGPMLNTMRRAKKSALSSLGWWIRGELRNHVEYGGSGWPDLHPMSSKFRKKRGVGSAWRGRRRGKHETAMGWLGKFARYLAHPNGDGLIVMFGKSARKDTITTSKFLMGVVKRAEEGERIRVTEKMRRFFGTTRRKRPKKQTVGQTYFPLKKTTTVLEIPKRPIFDPVERKVQPRAPGYFKDKFIKALERYAGK